MPLKLLPIRTVSGSSLVDILIILILMITFSGQIVGVNCRTIRNTGRSNHNFQPQRWIPRQDVGQVVPILTPGADLAVDAIAEGAGVVAGVAADSYLPDLGFWADFTNLMFSGSSISPMVRLSRDVFESQQCAEYFSCHASRVSRMYSPLQFMHTFLQDLPFRGDLADRVKKGSIRSVRDVKKKDAKNICGFDCSPLQYLNRGVKTLSLLHTVAKAANPRTDLSEL